MESTSQVSKLRGNYSGLTNTDEGDRDSPNVNRSFDLWYQTLNVSWEENIGPLQSDRRYSATIFGSYAFDKEQLGGVLNGLVMGFTQSIMDGLPNTTEVQLNTLQGYYPFGRADRGRMPMITQTDIYAEYNFELTEGYRAQFSINVTNLFDQDTVTAYGRSPNRDALKIDPAILKQLYESGQPLDIMSYMGEGTGVRLSEMYGMESAFQGSRYIRLGFKLSF